MPLLTTTTPMAAIDCPRHLTNTMAHRLDKLEKFFSKKKTTTTSTTTASPRSSTGSNMSTSSFSSSVHSDPLQPLFPPPSFIRPKASRMRARDDAPKFNARIRTPPPQRSASGRLSPDDAHDMKPLDSQGGNSGSSSLRIPHRSSSLLARRKESSPHGMTPLQTTNLKKRRSIEASSRLVITLPHQDSLPQPQPAAKYLLEPLPIYPALRVDTPPPSDQDEDYSPTTSSLDLHKCLPPAPLLSQPTPGPSPEMTPIRDSILSEPTSSPDFNFRNHLRTQSEEVAGSISPQEIPLRKIVSDSNLPNTPMMLDIKRDLILEEPEYRDFLSLSDDEIVGERKSLIPAPLTPARPPPRHLPPSPPIPPPSARVPVPAPLSPSRAGIMPSTPITGVPAALAALEAARIAKKYDFDLVYIVNLWPNRTAKVPSRGLSGASPSAHSPPISPTSSITPAPWLSESSSLVTPRGSIIATSDHGIRLDGTASCTGKNSGMTSRLLTGYGLAQLQHPFRLSTSIHKEFLRADGWVEFRQDDAKPEEFARGYACSFYTGHSTNVRRAGSAAEPRSMKHTHANSTQSAGQADNKRKRRSNNRGVVFAAYRKARSDGGSICSGAAELSALHQDAETLVELCLDFHHVQRPQRSSDVPRRASEGSVPSRAHL